MVVLNDTLSELFALEIQIDKHEKGQYAKKRLEIPDLET